MTRNKKTLLVGGSGNLGSSIIRSELFKNLYSPKKKDFNLLNRYSIRKTLSKNKFDLIINCAAMARVLDCEKNVSKAININIGGTFNLVREILCYEINYKRKIKLIHISSDAVYPSQKGNYSEKSRLGPYNIYGWTKIASEYLVRLVDEHIIIRTRFFNKEKIKFKKSASDIFTSKIEVNDLVKKIKMVSSKSYVGVVNVGSKRRSDYDIYKRFKNNLKSCKRRDIMKSLDVNLAKDASMNLSLLKKIEKYL